MKTKYSPEQYEQAKTASKRYNHSSPAKNFEGASSNELGGGGVQGQGKGQRLMTTFGWQHAKVESTKSNPPTPLGAKMLSC